MWLFGYWLSHSTSTVVTCFHSKCMFSVTGNVAISPVVLEMQNMMKSLKLTWKHEKPDLWNLCSSPPCVTFSDNQQDKCQDKIKMHTKQTKTKEIQILFCPQKIKIKCDVPLTILNNAVPSNESKTFPKLSQNSHCGFPEPWHAAMIKKWAVAAIEFVVCPKLESRVKINLQAHFFYSAVTKRTICYKVCHNDAGHWK